MKSRVEIEKYKDELTDQLFSIDQDDQFYLHTINEIEKELQIMIETLEYVLKWALKKY